MNPAFPKSGAKLLHIVGREHRLSPISFWGVDTISLSCLPEINHLLLSRVFLFKLLLKLVMLIKSTFQKIIRQYKTECYLQFM